MSRDWCAGRPSLCVSEVEFNIYNFPSVASAMWVRMCGVKCITARFKRIWFQGLALIRDSWFLDKSRNLIVCVSVDPVDSVEYRFV